MATILDEELEAFWTPIDGDHPAGVDLSAETPPAEDPYHRLTSAVFNARRFEKEFYGSRSHDPDNAPSDGFPEWREVAELAPVFLQERTKDLGIASDYLEALVRVEGLPGLIKGLKIINGLLERFWGQLHAPFADGQLEWVLKPLADLCGSGGSLFEPLRRVSLAEYGNYGEHCVADYDTLQKSPDSAREGVTMDSFQRAIADSSPEHFQRLIEQLAEARDELDRLDAQLRERLTTPDELNFKPPVRPLRDHLQDIERAVRNIASAKLAGLVSEMEGDGAHEGNGEGAGPVARAASSAPGGPPMSREDAFRQLTLIADYFEKHEPLSLLGEQIRRVVRLGRMKPHEYFASLIDDETARQQLFRLVGIEAQNSEE